MGFVRGRFDRCVKVLGNDQIPAKRQQFPRMSFETQEMGDASYSGLT